VLAVPSESGDLGDVLAFVVPIATALGVVLAVVALIIEGRRNRRALVIGNLWRLIDQWDSSHMRERRASVAAALLDDFSGPRRITNEAIDVVNTFELLGFLLRTKRLEVEDAWANFSVWAISWWYVYESEIAGMQRRDQTVFEDFQSLVRELVSYEIKRRNVPSERVVPTETDVREFLETERNLPARLHFPVPSPKGKEPSWARFVRWFRGEKRLR
jgi:hypothetical protein